MKRILIILFLGLQSVAFTQVITNTYPDTIYVGDTLKVETISYVWDNGSNPPLFCTDLLQYTDTITPTKITFDKLYNYFGGAFSRACNDTVNFTGLSAGNYQLIGFWSRIRNFSSNSDTIIRYASDTIIVTVLNATKLKEYDLSEIIIAPNPVQNLLKISNTSNLDIISTEIWDIKGRSINKSEEVNDVINVSNLNEGLYLLKVYTKQGVKLLKFIKK